MESLHGSPLVFWYPQECIAALDLRDGRTQVRNVTLDRSIPTTELEQAGIPLNLP